MALGVYAFCGLLFFGVMYWTMQDEEWGLFEILSVVFFSVVWPAMLIGTFLSRNDWKKTNGS